MRDEMSTKEVWNSLVARPADPRAHAIGERFADAVASVRNAASIRDVVLRRYLGGEYNAVMARTDRLEPEDATRIIIDRVMIRAADGDLSSADLRAIGDAISRVGELDLALGDALERLHTVFEEAVNFLRSESRT